MQLEKTVFNELVEITKKAYPNEACAFLFVNNTIVIEGHPEKRSPVYFGGFDTTEVFKLIQKYGNPTSLFHSHPGGNTPSGTDEKYMKMTMRIWGSVWLIMSSSLKLASYHYCPLDTRDFGKLVYRKEEVEIVNGQNI